MLSFNHPKPTKGLDALSTALGATRLDGSRSGRQEPGSTKGTPEAVKAGRAKTSAHDAGWADVKETKEVVETSQDAGKEEEQPELQTEQEEPQQQQREQSSQP
jgi:hypothetical protein